MLQYFFDNVILSIRQVVYIHKCLLVNIYKLYSKKIFYLYPSVYINWAAGVNHKVAMLVELLKKSLLTLLQSSSEVESLGPLYDNYRTLFEVIPSSYRI